MLFPFHRETESRDLIDCISMWQPWASWVAWGFKSIETRTHARFQSLAGRRLVIHAAREWDEKALACAREYLSAKQLDELQRRNYPRGAFVALVNVTDHRLLGADDSAAALIDCASVPRYGLQLVVERELIPPLAARGRQGIWQVPASLVSASQK